MRTLFPIAVVLLVVFALPGVAVFAADLTGYGGDVNTWLEGTFGVSHRVTIALPAAVILFLIPPLLILLYFLRLKRKPIAVPSTFLWQKSIEDLHVNRLMQWIRQNILLLMQLLAILMLIYGVLGPRLHGAIVGGKHYILIVDNSVSMSAIDVAPDADRLAWARAEALKEIDAATDADSGMVIAFNDTAEIRQSYTTNRAALRRAVEAIEPTNHVTRVDEALSLAASLANPARSTENEAAAPADPEPGKERTYVGVEGMSADVHLYSDGQFPPVPDFALANLNLTYHVPPAPANADNLAITALTAERHPDDRTRVIARAVVHNYRDKPVSPKLGLELLDGDGTLLARYEEDRRAGETPAERAARTTIPPGTSRPDITFTIPDVPEVADSTLRLRIDEANDALPADDTAWLVLGIVRKARVLVVGPRNERLRDFLDSAAAKRIADVTYYGAEVLAENADPEKYSRPAREGQYDLVIFDRCGPATPEAMPAANTFFVGHPPPSFVPAGGATPGDPNAVEPVVGPSIRGWQSRHPVMQNLRALDTIAIAEGFRMPELPPRTDRLIEGDNNLVLLAAIPRRAYTDLVLAFPLMTDAGEWNTTWPLQVTFPLFMRNVLFALGNVRDSGVEESIRPGGVQVVRPGGAMTARIRMPDGSLDTLDRGTRPDFLIAGTDQLGVYAVTWSNPDGGEATRRFAVNLFDPLESDLTPAPAVTIGTNTIIAGEPRKEPVDLWKLPVLLGLIAVVMEWWVYNKRVSI